MEDQLEKAIDDEWKALKTKRLGDKKQTKKAPKPTTSAPFLEDNIAAGGANDEDDEDLFRGEDEPEPYDINQDHHAGPIPPINLNPPPAGSGGHNPEDVEDDSEDEGIEDYKMGGYHPVHVGEVLLDRYVIIQKLGWGHFSTVWLSKDFHHDTYVAIKVQKSAPHYLEAAYDEVEILQKVARQTNNPVWINSLKEYYKDRPGGYTRDDCHVVQLLNSFIYKGPYGNHFCMVFEIMGVTLLEIIKRYNYKGVPMHLCRVLAKQVLIGLDYLHRMCSLIHTDIKPENVLLCLTPAEIREIYDKGMLSRSKTYNDRIRSYQQKHGIKMDPKLEDDEHQPNGRGGKEGAGSNKDDEAKVQELLKKKEDLKVTGQQMSKTQRKNAKKRLRQKIKREQEKTHHKDSSNLHDVTGEHNAAEDDDEENKAAEGDKTNPQESRQSFENLKKKENISARQGSHPAYEKSQYGNGEDHMSCQPEIGRDSSESPAIHDEIKQLGEVHMPKKTSSPQKVDKATWRGPKLDDKVQVKIVDLGNACWFHHHFTPLIQTRQYRSPETIIGVHYGPSADIWSFACMIFEMLTGDFLFEPRKGPNFSKSDDHLAQVIELTRKFPKSFACSGRDSRKFFDRHGNLRRIQGFHFWSLKDVLIEKYRLKETEAQAFSDFLLPMLEFFPDRRASAQQALKAKWFNMPPETEFRMDEKEYREYQTRKKTRIDEEDLFPSKHDAEEDDAWDGECEENPDDDSPRHPNGNMIMTPYSRAILDRTFYHGGYIGYGEGISLGEIDQGSNWQFHKLDDTGETATFTKPETVLEEQKVSGEVEHDNDEEPADNDEEQQASAAGNKKKKKRKNKNKNSK